MSRTKYNYTHLIAPLFLNKFNYLPLIERIVISSSSKQLIQNSLKLYPLLSSLQLITDQKPVITRIHKSIAGFSIKENMVIGAKVELKGNKIYTFIDILTNLILPSLTAKNIKINKNSITIGIDDLSLFPQIEDKTIKQFTGLNITINTNTKSETETRFLMRGLQFPTQ